MSNTRIAKWDNMKFLLMLCVVMGHVLDYYTDQSPVWNWLNFFIYIFHMPAFIFVSGFVYVMPVVAILILLLTSLRPLGTFIDKIINPPLIEERAGDK